MVKKFSEKQEAWMRIIVLIVTGIILYVWGWLTIILLIINFLVTIFTGKRRVNLAEFCEYWNTESYKFYRYMTFMSNIRPFPFTNLEKISKFK